MLKPAVIGLIEIASLENWQRLFVIVKCSIRLFDIGQVFLIISCVDEILMAFICSMSSIDDFFAFGGFFTFVGGGTRTFLDSVPQQFPFIKSWEKKNEKYLT